MPFGRGAAYTFFQLKGKKELKEQIYAVSRLDLDDANTVIKALSDINENIISTLKFIIPQAEYFTPRTAVR